MVATFQTVNVNRVNHIMNVAAKKVSASCIANGVQNAPRNRPRGTRSVVSDDFNNKNSLVINKEKYIFVFLAYAMWQDRIPTRNI